MKLDIKGTLLRVDKETGTSAKGEWQKFNVWVLSGENQIMASFFGDKWAYLYDIQEGSEISIVAYLATREYNGKGYTQINGVDFKGGEVAKAVRGGKKLDKEFEQKVESDGLPF